ncbi:MAG: hypothetical protein JWQ38_1187 [Flavipsychrobacter sp.]|nr:hypothetical protein [Flavipsychrobacter sp.]
MFGQNTVMKGTLALALFFILFASCDSANNQHPSAKYEEKKTSLESMEQDSPLKFLKVKGDFHRNFVNKTVIEGEITNNATLVSYKDLQLVLIFRDEKGSVIEKQKQQLDNIIKPNSTEDFKIKISHVKGANSLSVDITDAKVNK